MIQKRLSRRCNTCSRERRCAKFGGAAFAVPAQISINATRHTTPFIDSPPQFLENCSACNAASRPRRPQPLVVTQEQFTSRGIPLLSEVVSGFHFEVLSSTEVTARRFFARRVSLWNSPPLFHSETVFDLPFSLSTRSVDPELVEGCPHHLRSPSSPSPKRERHRARSARLS